MEKYLSGNTRQMYRQPISRSVLFYAKTTTGCRLHVWTGLFSALATRSFFYNVVRSGSLAFKEV